jgi:hypothetical protein
MYNSPLWLLAKMVGVAIAALVWLVDKADDQGRIWSKFVLYSAPAISLHTRTGH